MDRVRRGALPRNAARDPQRCIDDLSSIQTGQARPALCIRERLSTKTVGQTHSANTELCTHACVERKALQDGRSGHGPAVDSFDIHLEDGRAREDDEPWNLLEIVIAIQKHRPRRVPRVCDPQRGRRVDVPGRRIERKAPARVARVEDRVRAPFPAIIERPLECPRGIARSKATPGELSTLDGFSALVLDPEDGSDTDAWRGNARVL